MVFFWSHLTTGNKDPFSTVLTCSWFGTVGLKHPVNLLCLWTMHSGNRSHWTWLVFCTLLAVHLGTILVNNLLDALIQCIYFISVHVSNNPVLIIRRINCFNTSSGIYHSVWVTGIGIPDSHPHTVINTRWRIDTLILLMMSTGLFERCTEVK